MPEDFEITNDDRGTKRLDHVFFYNDKRTEKTHIPKFQIMSFKISNMDECLIELVSLFYQSKAVDVCSTTVLNVYSD